MDPTRNDTLESRLAERARKGDQAALEELVSRLRGPMFAVAYPVCGQYEDAQDAVSSALFRVCQRIDTLRDPAQVRSFILRITRREALRLRQKRTLLASFPADEPDVPHDIDLRLDIERALRELPRGQAQAISLFYFGGLTVGDIAHRLQRPEGTIKYWLSRGRAQLYTTLEGYEPIMETTAAPKNVACLIGDGTNDWLESAVDALRAGGWDEVRLLNDAHAFLKQDKEKESDSRIALQALLTDVRFIVLDESVGGLSAFALYHLIRCGAAGKEALLMLLADGNRDAAENDAIVMAAYLAGFDLLLMKPFASEDLEQCARRAHRVISEND